MPSIIESDRQTIELIVNGDRMIFTNFPDNGILEVYSIIGSKVASIEIKSGHSDTPINIPKGYYIIKSQNISRKIAIK